MIRGLTMYAIIAVAGLAGAPACADAAAPAQSPTLDNPLATLSLAELGATRDRPLFTPSRRPPAPPAVARASPPPPPPAPPAAPELALYGTLLGGNGAIAIVRTGSEKPVHVRIGDKVDGWAVTEIEERQIVLALGGRSATFAMFNGGHLATPGAVVNYHLPRPLVAVNAQGVLRRVGP